MATMLLPSVALLLLLGVCVGQNPPPQPFYTFPEDVLYVGQARFDGVVLPQPSPTGQPSTTQGGSASRKDTFRSTFSHARRRKTSSSAPPASGNVTELPVSSGNPDPVFNGINLVQNAYSGQGGIFYKSQIVYTPPDVTLCAGNGFIIQTVNSGSIVAYDYTGRIKAGVLSLSQFLGLFPNSFSYPPTDPVTGYGDFIYDTNCVFDKGTRRFFLTAGWGNNGLSPLLKLGQLRSSGGCGTFVAVSGILNPIDQPWSVYFIPGTNDGYSSHNDSAPPLNYPSPTYIQDYPQIGTDFFGVYISTNQYGTEDFRGSNIYAISKIDLIVGRPNIKAVRFAIPESSPDLDALSTLIPAKTPGDGKFDLRSNGTMYFVSSISSSTDTRKGFVLWTITGTSTLGKSPALKLDITYVDSPPYTYTVEGAPQKDGPIPVGKSLDANNVEGTLNTNFGDRIIQSAWANGKIWLTLSTAYGNDNLTGVVVASISPNGSSQGAKLSSFTTFGVKNSHALFPAISLNSKGKGIIAFALTGTQYYPTSAYVTIDSTGKLGDSALIAASGVAPLDVFDAYSNPGVQGIMRYGDWQTVNIDEKGNAWAAVEYVSSKGNVYLGGNWATSIFRIKL